MVCLKSAEFIVHAMKLVDIVSGGPRERMDSRLGWAPKTAFAHVRVVVRGRIWSCYFSDRFMRLCAGNSKWRTRFGRYLRSVHRLSALYRIKIHRRVGDMNVFCNNYTWAITVLKSLQFACDSTAGLVVRSMDMQIIQTIGLSWARFVKKMEYL